MLNAFEYRADARGAPTLHAEGVSLAEIAHAVGTPAYCYASGALVARYEALQSAAPSAEIRYSIKANDTLAVIRTLARLGAGGDVVSGGELRRAMAAGIAPDRTVFAGVGKTREEIDHALSVGIGQLNVESAAELSLADAVALSRGTRAPVALRVNPDVDAETHDKIATGRRGDKFGIDIDKAPALFAEAVAREGITPVGIAIHIGSQLTSLAPFEAAFERVAALVEALRGAGHSVDRLDLGGGLGIRYTDEAPPTAAAYGTLVEQVRERLGVTVLLEPGRALIGPAGVLLTRVIAVKSAGGRTYAIVDAAMNDLIRPAMYGAVHQVQCVTAPADDAPREVLDLAGPICESGDVLARNCALPRLHAGDLLALRDVGAYGSVMASTYNSRLLPAEVMVRGDAFAVIRPRQTYEALLARDQLPEWLSES